MVWLIGSWIPGGLGILGERSTPGFRPGLPAVARLRRAFATHPLVATGGRGFVVFNRFPIQARTLVAGNGCVARPDAGCRADWVMMAGRAWNYR